MFPEPHQPPLFRLFTLGQLRLERGLSAHEATCALPDSSLAGGDEAAHGATRSVVAGGVTTPDQAAMASILQQRRARLLLTCLISTPGRRLTRQQICYLIWPDLDGRAAEHQLDRAVCSLRRLFEPEETNRADSLFLRTDHSLVSLADQELIWIDADALEATLSRAHTTKHQKPGVDDEILEAAANLYRGDFLPQEYAFERVDQRREQIRRVWISLMLELADRCLACSANLQAITVLDRLLAVDPACEAATQRMMHALNQMGRRGEAIQAYYRCLVFLQHDYGILPHAGTQALYEQICGRPGHEPHEGQNNNEPDAFQQMVGTYHLPPMTGVGGEPHILGRNAGCA